MTQTTLNERVENWNDVLSFDLENRLVLNVALAGQTSRNGYRYTAEALATAVQLYADKPVFLDHAPKRHQPLERSTRDLVGTVQNPRFVSGRILGDIRVLNTESGETFLQLAQSETPGVGMSHVVVALRSADGKTVEQITEVISVDAVINPATTTTFSESTAESTWQLQVESLRNERDELRLELQTLKSVVHDLQVRESVRELVAASTLPQAAVTECFERQLLNAETVELRQQLIEDRCALLSGKPRKVSRTASFPRVLTERASASDEEFLRVFRKR